MSDLVSSAKVNLTVNGKQPQEQLTRLKARAEDLRDAIAKAARAGDKANTKKWEKELSRVRREMRQIQSNSEGVEQVMKRLDKSTPKELKAALKSLNKELEGMERGTKAWKSQIAKIKQVREELNKVNRELATQQSMWSRMNGWLNNCQTALLGFTAAVTGLIMAGRKAVNIYAEMDEQLANTRKYTGMAADDVIELNNAFKKMDTRTPRAKLNELAQEAGRLGKNALDTVQGYVEAADIINVALVDLGEGATQTIAKLTNIFGVEKMLGTKEAMLAVGSTVNVLSQNCTASKPYLVEFAQRMAGIGSQAGLTIPQIIALGAVLDANGQKVEMSATAIQKVLMNLANKNQQFAKVVGLDAETLNRTLKNSARDGLLMFLEALQKIGKESDFDNATMVLAPALKDMGLDAARVSQVLSTLAMHLDEVKWQMGEADKAFKEASSATREYQIFNNTAQASIDKAKKRVSELAVELGEELYPIMKHIYTSSGVFLRILSKMVSFFIENRVEILSIAGALITYNAVVGIYNARAAIAARTSSIWAGAMAILKTALPPVKLIMAGLINTIQYFTKGLRVNYEMQQRWQNALKGMSFANWAGLAVAAIAAVVLIWDKLAGKVDKFKKSMAEAMGKMGDFNLEAKKEKEELDKLFGALKGARKESEDFRKAKEKLLSQYGQYIKGLINERGEITNLEEAYRRLANVIKIANQERGIKNAKDSIDDSYQKEMKQLSNDLYSTLVDYGCSVQEAAKLQAAVITAMQMGVPIDESSRVRINELAKSDRKAIEGKSSWGARFKYNLSGAMNMITGGMVGSELKADPAEIVNRMYAVTSERDKAMGQVEATARENRPLRDLQDNFLELGLEYAKSAKENGGTVMVVLDAVKGTFELVEKSKEEAQKVYEMYAAEIANRGVGGEQEEASISDGGSFVPLEESESKATDKFQREKEWRQKREAEARIAYATGKKDYISYVDEMNEIAVEYQRKMLEHSDLGEAERLSIQADYEEAKKKQSEQWAANRVDDENKLYEELLAEARQSYIDGALSKKSYDEEIERIESEHLKKLSLLYAEGSKERTDVDKKLQDKLIKQMQERQKETEALEKEYAKIKDSYFGDNPNERQQKYDAEIAMLDIVYQRELAAAGDNAAEKLRIEEAYQKAKLALQKKYGLASVEDTRNSMQRAVDDSIKWLDGDGGKAMTGTLETLQSGMSAIFSQLSSIVQAELEIQTAAINKRYDEEISRAEGNSYLVAKLEKQKEADIAKAKNEANKKMFAMQVIQAVAQTATNALNAYGSAAAIPVVGYILAPIAAAMAVAAGMMQVAAIKKQQQASEAQGYSSGGFTPDGPVDQPAGVVHAGEWVASQKLVKHPATRPMILALDAAQRGNAIGMFRSADVAAVATRTIPASADGGQAAALALSASAAVSLSNAAMRMTNRLNEPFVTINSESGDYGMQQAREKYAALLKNKSPKYRK